MFLIEALWLGDMQQHHRGIQKEVVPHQPGIKGLGMRKPENRFLHLLGTMQRTAYLAVPRLHVQELLRQHRSYGSPAHAPERPVPAHQMEYMLLETTAAMFTSGVSATAMMPAAYTGSSGACTTEWRQ